MSAIGKLLTLESLILNEIDVEGSIEPLAKLQQLKAFDLSGSKFQEEELRYLKSLPNLRVIALMKCPGLTDAGILNVARTKNLNELAVGDTQITDRAMASLKKVDGLEILVASGCGISDAGVADICARRI